MFLALLLSVSLAHAGDSGDFTVSAWPPKNSLCAEARLSNLWIDGSKNVKATEDLCARRAEKTPEVFRVAIADIQSIHRKVAAAFSLDLLSAFPEGVAVHITAGDRGLDGVYSAKSRVVEIDTLSSPDRWVNPGVYAHELGHWITASSSARIPLALRRMFGSSFFAETIADTIAMATVESVGSPEPGLPKCLLGRTIEGFQSYRAPIGYFLTDFSLRRKATCCSQPSLIQSENAKKICSAGQNDDEGNGIGFEGPFHRESFLNRQKIELNIGFDPHQIGIPINSFLLKLGKTIGQNGHQLFLNSARDVRPTSYDCSIPASNEKLVVDEFRLEDYLATVRSGLSLENQKTFDNLFAKHSLSEALKLDAEDIPFRVQRDAVSAFLSRETQCRGAFEELEFTGELPENCRVSCERIRE